MHTRSSATLSIAALACLLIALILAAPLAERLSAVAWEWYKFGGEGAIYLSKATGLVYTAFLAAGFGLSMAINYHAKRRSIRLAKVASFLAMLVLAINAAGYWLLGMSTFNVWRA